MNCDTCQSRLCEQLDIAPEAPFAPDLEAHLSACPVCRRFQQTLQALDEQLTRQAGQATLPVDFAATVLARVPHSQPRLSPAEIAGRKARCEHEYQIALAAHDWGRSFKRGVVWLRLASFALLCAGIGWLFADALRQANLPETWVQLQSYSASAAPWLAYGLGLAMLAFGMLVARRPLLLRKLA
jgi:hypothetical protein